MSIEARMAEVLRRHMYESLHDADFPDGLDEPSLGFQRDPDVKKWSEKVAKAVVAELGLTAEYGLDVKGRQKPNPIAQVDHRGRPADNPGVIPDGWRPYQRYVTDWEPTL